MQNQLECRRCGYKWQRRKTGALPKQCVRCKSMLWDEEEVRGRGRPPKPVVEDPLTITADTIAEFKAEEPAPVVAVLDVPMVKHGENCGCTECRLWRGEL